MALTIYTMFPQDGNKELLICISLFSGIIYNPILFPGFITHQTPTPNPKIQTVICSKKEQDHSSSRLG